jgi:LacI family transcriptional regulator
MNSVRKSPEAGRSGERRSVTIKDLAADLGLSITTISRALNGYSDVGDGTRRRVAEAARRMGYRPNRNAQRLVTRRTHNIAWVQSDNDRKFVDPHFVEVMAGVLRGARAGNYDIVMRGDTPDRELQIYDRYVNDNSVDGFIVDLPREGDPRISYLLEVGRPFVVHGREARADSYGWVDIDNYANFYNLTRLLIANGHRHIAFVNGDEHFTYALYRRRGVIDALRDAGHSSDDVTILNSVHPMGEAGFKLTSQVLADPRISAILYSSTLMAVEGHAVVLGAGARRVEIVTMDDELHYLDLSPYAGRWSFVRSSLREAGSLLMAELVSQCERGAPPGGHIVPSSWHPLPHLDARVLAEPLPLNRR